MQSGFNPVIGMRKLQGDLLYLEVLTLENIILNITCSTMGFFINKSENKHFDGNNKTNKIYISLIDSLVEKSNGFKKQWEKLVN